MVVLMPLGPNMKASSSSADFFLLLLYFYMILAKDLKFFPTFMDAEEL